MDEPIDINMSDYSKEEATYALRILEVFCDLRKAGIDQVTAATIMVSMGVPKEDIPQSAYETKYFLTEMFLENAETIIAALQSRVEPKH